MTPILIFFKTFFALFFVMFGILVCMALYWCVYDSCRRANASDARQEALVLNEMKTARPVADVEAKEEPVEAIPDAVNVAECEVPATESTKPTEKKGDENDLKRTSQTQSRIALKKDLIMVSIEVDSSLVNTQVVEM